MVTVQQAVQKLGRAKREVEERESEISKAERRARAIREPAGTITKQFELEKRFGRGRAAAGLKRVRREARERRTLIFGRVRKAREELAPVKKRIIKREGEIKRFQAQKSEAEAFNRDLKFARKLAGRGQFPFGESKRIKRLFTKIRQGLIVKQERIEKLRAIGELGLAPIFKRGELVGFKSEELKKTITLQELPPEFLPPLQKAGVIQIKEIPLSIGEFRRIEAGITAREKELSIGEFRAIEAKIGARGFFTPLPEVPKAFFERVAKEAERPSLTDIGAFPGSREVLATLAVTGREVQKILRAPGFGRRFGEGLPTTVGGFAAGTGAELIPTTKEQVTIFGAAPLALGALPAVATKVSLGAFAGVQLPRAFVQPDITLEQRVAIGVTGIAALGGAAFLPTRFQLGIKQQKAQLKLLEKAGFISRETAESLTEGIKLQPFLRGQPDVPVVKPTISAIPERLTILEKEAFAKPLLAEDIRIFGGKALELRGLKIAKDIDIAAKESARILGELETQLQIVSPRGVVRRGEAISIRGEPKGFDIKSLERIEAFPFAERPAKTLEGKPISKLSEEFARGLSRALGVRKAGKGIESASISARGIIEQSAIRARATSLPGLKQFRQFKVAIAERRLEKFRFAIPELEIRALQAGELGIAPEAKIPFVPTTAFPELFPIGKAGRLGGFQPPTGQFKLPTTPLTELAARRELDSFFVVPKGFKIPRVGQKAPRLRPSELAPSRIVPSGFKPIIPSLIKPSDIIPSKIKPSGVPFGPSIIKPSEDGFRITGVPSIIPPPPSPPPTRVLALGVPTVPAFTFPTFEGDGFAPFRKVRKARRRPEKKKGKVKRKRIVTPIRPSLTAIVAELKGALPKEVKIAGVELGIIPSRIRRVPRRRATKVRKRKKR